MTAPLFPEDLAETCKAYEAEEAARACPRGRPLLARLDGRSFHTYSRGCDRPFDARLQECMVAAAEAVLLDLHPAVAYTQSDEITVAWFARAESTTDYPFGGRYQKLASVLASVAGVAFDRRATPNGLRAKRPAPAFDCRVWSVPTSADAAEVFQWRELDAVRNSVLALGQNFFTARQMHGKGQAEIHAMLAGIGVSWADQQEHFRRGLYLRRVTIERELTEVERVRIPESYRPPPGQLVERSEVRPVPMPMLAEIEASAAALLLGLES